MDVVRKIEQLGSSDGKPVRPVKITDCGEISENKIGVSIGKDTGKKKKLGKVPSDDASDRDIRGRHKRSLKDTRKKRRRSSSSSDLGSSDSDYDSDSSSSDSDTGSDSGSSLSDSSSDGRHRKRRSVKRDRHKQRKKRKEGQKERKRGRYDKQSRRKSKWSSDSTSNTETDSVSSSTSSSSDDEKYDHVSAPKSKKLTTAKKKLIQSNEVGKNSSPHPTAKESVAKLQEEHKPKAIDANSSHEEGELSPNRNEHQDNQCGEDSKFQSERSANHHSRLDNVNTSRKGTPSPKRRPNNSCSPICMSPENASQSLRIRNDGRSPARKSGELDHGRSSRSPLVSHVQKAVEPSSNNRGRDLSRSRSPNGVPKRVRKGRGFTERYSFARRYRTPSPDRSPLQSYPYGGIHNNERKYDRYSSYRGYSEQSRYGYSRSSPRGRSPPRYGGRKGRSRSISSSLGRRRNYRGHSRSQSPIRSPSPRERPPPISKGLKSRLGPRVGDVHSVDKGRYRSHSSSRSRSLESSLSKSPDALPPKRRGRTASRSRSSSPSGRGGLVSYGDASPDIETR
uniref:Peptidyl-prolyl cis-trans isomerase CYP63 isoform X3 n=1 Tax=Rhizophora mucronata TaxID=61149 RepID=A0A2P2L2H8_RHIMU